MKHKLANLIKDRIARADRALESDSPNGAILNLIDAIEMIVEDLDEGETYQLGYEGEDE